MNERPRPSDQDLLARPELDDAVNIAAGWRLPLFGDRIVIIKSFHPNRIGSHEVACSGPQDIGSFIQQRNVNLDVAGRQGRLLQ